MEVELPRMLKEMAGMSLGSLKLSLAQGAYVLGYER